MGGWEPIMFSSSSYHRRYIMVSIITIYGHTTLDSTPSSYHRRFLYWRGGGYHTHVSTPPPPTQVGHHIREHEALGLVGAHLIPVG